MALPRSLLKFSSPCSKSTFLFRSFSRTATVRSDGDPTRPPSAQMTSLLDIGSRTIFTSEHDALRESARRFFQNEVAPHVLEWEKQGFVSREVWEKAGENGFLGAIIPSEHFGSGSTYKEASVLIEEQFYVNSSAPGFRIHSYVTLPYISNYGNEEQIKRYMPDLVSGKKIAAIAMSEPGAGSDLQSIRTSAKKRGDDYILNGSKTFITNGYLSDVVVVVAVTDPNAKKAAHGISLFIVDTDSKGFSKGKPLKKIGDLAQDTCELFFEDIVLPKSQLLGEENHGFYYLMNDLPRERMNIAVGACALLEFLFEETRNYVKDRKVFGKALSGKQTVQHKLAEMKTEICVARAFMDQCIQLLCEKKLDTNMAAMAKYYMSDLVNRVAYQSVQLHGGMGFMWETSVARAYCNVRVNPIYGGTNEIMKELISRKIVNE